MRRRPGAPCDLRWRIAFLEADGVWLQVVLDVLDDAIASGLHSGITNLKAEKIASSNR